MRIFQNYSIPAFSIIRENIPFTIDAQHKRIGLIVSIAIGIIAACYLAMHYLKFRTPIEDISTHKENAIDWDSVMEPPSRNQMQFDNFKKLLSHSPIDSCPYKKIYVAFLGSGKPSIVFDEDSNHYAHVKHLPCPPSEALLIYIPEDAAKSKQIETFLPKWQTPFGVTQNPFGMNQKMISHEEYRQSQRQGYFSSEIIEHLFN